MDGRKYDFNADMKKVFKRLGDRTFCIDCGKETNPGTGSKRCSECWDNRCGYCKIDNLLDSGVLEHELFLYTGYLAEMD